MRRSDTSLQQQYENEILRQHYPDNGSHEGVPNGTPDPQRHSQTSGVKSKLKSFYHKTVVPAFPEAIADLSAIKASVSARSSTTKEIHDASKHPEVTRIAEVRLGNDLCSDEQAFLIHRKKVVHSAFCRYLGLDPASVHPDDVPVIAFGGSGGGYRAMLGMIAYADDMKHTGFWDLLTYIAGVSGSCWSIAGYFTWANASTEALIEHCSSRLSPYHPLSPEAVRATLSAPDGAARTLGPIYQKHKSGLHTFPMDYYAAFLTGYLFLPIDGQSEGSGGANGGLDPPKESKDWSKWSSASEHLVNGGEPLPLLTAIRHERPWADWHDTEHPFEDSHLNKHDQAEFVDAWFQWFEMTPFEIGCDELASWCPTWGFGRPFSQGKSTMQLPEQSFALLLGLCTSAPAGPLNSYLATIKRNLPAGSLGESLHSAAKRLEHHWGPQGTEEFQQHHLLHAINEHNFMYHLNKKAGEPSPPGIENSPRIHLIDSGMDNNLPSLVLMRPQRHVDLILNMDASSDVLKDSFQQRVEQIGSRRSIRFEKRNKELKAGEEGDPDRYEGMYGQIYDGTTMKTRPEKVIDSYGHEVQNPPAEKVEHEVTMVYLPLLPNEKAVPGFDPSTEKWSGSYNLVWTREQVQMLVRLCRGNWRDAEETVKTALREVWERKRRERLSKSKAEDVAPDRTD